MDNESEKKDKFTFKASYKTSKELINSLIIYSRDNKAVFRGVSTNEQLKPAINRVRSQVNEWNSCDLVKEEFNLLIEFKKNAASMLNGYLDTLDIVAYAQHFGLATRFIDWTRDPLTALYFALSREKPKDGEYRIYYTLLEKHTLISKSYSGQTHFALSNGFDFIADYIGFIESIEKSNQNGNDINTIEDAINEREKFYGGRIKTSDYYRENSLVFFESNASNPRLIAQKGLFSIPVSIEGDAAREEIEKNCQYIILDFKENERIQTLEFLENLNYSALRLFPDIQNIASSIIDKHVFNQKKEQVDFAMSSKGSKPKGSELYQNL